MKELPICTGCQDDEKPISNTKVYGWICDECIADYEHADTLNIDKHESDNRIRITE